MTNTEFIRASFTSKQIIGNSIPEIPWLLSKITESIIFRQFNRTIYFVAARKVRVENLT